MRATSKSKKCALDLAIQFCGSDVVYEVDTLSDAKSDVCNV